MPVLMLVGGLVILVVGLVLLTGGRDARGARPGGPAWTADVAPPRLPEATAAMPPCDWSAWLDTGAGGRQPLRRARGRPCCHYVLAVRDLDPVPGATDEREEVLRWSGTATRLGPGGATTPLERDVVTRRATASPGHLQASLSLDGTPGPEVTTPGWQDDPGSDEVAAQAPDSRPAQLWSRHIDELRGHGAHPIPTDGARVPPVELRRRIEVDVRVERGCAPAAHAATVEARVDAQVSGTATTGEARLAAPLLASWVAVDGAVVAAADTPTTPVAGLASWAPVVDDQGAGVEAVADQFLGACRAAWHGGTHTTVDPTTIAVTVGTAVRLTLDAVGDPRAPVAAEVHATTEAFVRLRIDALRDAEADPGCTRCLPDVELFLGRDDELGVRPIAPGSTPGGAISLDGRVLHLCPPSPGGQPTWSVAAGDLDEHTRQHDDVHEVM